MFKNEKHHIFIIIWISYIEQNKINLVNVPQNKIVNFFLILMLKVLEKCSYFLL